MNINALIAVLVLKGILSKDEGEKLVEHLNNKPQSTQLADAMEQVSEFISKQVPKLTAAAKKVAAKTAEEVADEAQKVHDAAQKEADKLNGKKK